MTAETLILARFKLRRGVASLWTSANPILKDGEPGFETDTGQIKVGDGSTTWTGLTYATTGFSDALSALRGLTPAADRVPYFTGTTSAALATFTTFGRSVVACVDASAARTVLALAAIASSGSASDLSSGTVPSARMPAFTGDVTTVSGGVATTLATVNPNVGTFGSATTVAQITVNGKGLITGVSSVTITAPASSITGGAALTKVDDTNVTLTLGGTPSTALLAGVSITVGWSGVLAPSRGGTNNAFTAFSGPSSTTKTFTLPNASDTVACLGQAQAFTANQTFSSGLIQKDPAGSGSAMTVKLSFQDATNTERGSVGFGSGTNLFTVAAGTGILSLTSGSRVETSSSFRTALGSGGTITAFESDATRANRVIIGADANGGYIDTSYSTGGSGVLLVKQLGSEVWRYDGSGHMLPSADNTRDDGSSSKRIRNNYSVQYRPGSGAPIWTSGTGSPETVVTAPVGSLFTRTDGGANTTLYVKESGSGNTGWIAK